MKNLIRVVVIIIVGLLLAMDFASNRIYLWERTPESAPAWYQEISQEPTVNKTVDTIVRALLGPRGILVVLVAIHGWPWLVVIGGLVFGPDAILWLVKKYLC